MVICIFLCLLSMYLYFCTYSLSFIDIIKVDLLFQSNLTTFLCFVFSELLLTFPPFYKPSLQLYLTWHLTPITFYISSSWFTPSSSIFTYMIFCLFWITILPYSFFVIAFFSFKNIFYIILVSFYCQFNPTYSHLGREKLVLSVGKALCPRRYSVTEPHPQTKYLFKLYLKLMLALWYDSEFFNPWSSTSPSYIRGLLQGIYIWHGAGYLIHLVC